MPVQTPEGLLEARESTSLTPLIRCLQLQTPVPPSTEEDGCRTRLPSTLTWTAPLVWLEHCMPDSPVLATLRQSLPLSAQQEDKGTSITPLSVASAATWTTALSLVEADVNTSPAEKPWTKDSTTETDSLLWHCSLDQLGNLSRAELERRLESTLIIMEALSCHMCDCEKFQQPPAHVGPADQREAATQTPVSEPKEEEQMYRDLYVELRRRFQLLQRSRESEQKLAQQLGRASKEMREWSSESKEIQDIMDTSLQHLQDSRGTLSHQHEQMRGLLSRCRSSLQRSSQDREEMKARLQKALEAKEAADQVLDSVRSHAAARIGQLEQSLESQQHLRALLEEARGHQADLVRGYAECSEQGDRLATKMKEDWTSMRLSHEAFTKLLKRFKDTMRRMQEELKAARQELTTHREVCSKLEERTVELVEALGQVNKLTNANSSLSKEMGTMQEKLISVEEEQERLQQERELLAQQLAEQKTELERMTRLSREKEQEWDSILKDLREAMDCGEFLELESQLARRQLREREEELKAALSTLRERSAQLEDFKDACKELQQKQEAIGKELASAREEIRSTGASMEKFSTALVDIGVVQEQFLAIADSLKAALHKEVHEEPQWSRACTPAPKTPHGLGASFVDSILLAAAGKDVETPGFPSPPSAFTKVTPVVPPAPAEIQESLANRVQELQEAANRLHLLSNQYRKATQEEVRGLQAENLQLEHQLETLKLQLQNETDSRDVTIAELHKALRLRIQNEKELRDVISRHDEQMQLSIDQGGELLDLQGEVAQLRRALQKAETEAAVLWEELRGAKPCDPDWIQEKISLRQRVEKLREMLAEKESENSELLAKHQGQTKRLECQLHQAQQALRHYREAEVEMREVLSTLPAEVVNSAELQNLKKLLL
ncbi:sperm-associated antigen 5 isoform X2 [Hemicordylus capensis]|nr:sperm-associated antigen 5 isoform X2 [Hemicordylus capensis]